MRLSNIKAALIDMDGVLYDSMPYHAAAWHRMMLETTSLNIPKADFFEYEGMTGHATICLIMKERLGREVSMQQCQEMYALKSRYFREYGEKKMMPGASEVLNILKESGITRVLVTGSAQKSLLESLCHDYPGAFEADKMVTAMDVTHGKPHPEPYLRGLEKAGCSPSEAIVIENAPLGIEAGKAAGCHVIAVATGPIPHEKLLQAGASEIYDSMTSLADALSKR